MVLRGATAKTERLEALQALSRAVRDREPAHGTKGISGNSQINIALTLRKVCSVEFRYTSGSE